MFYPHFGLNKLLQQSHPVNHLSGAGGLTEQTIEKRLNEILTRTITKGI